MDPSGGAVAGPSRPRRVPGPMDLGDRIIAAQRRNASAAGPSRAPTRQTPQPDEYSRGTTQPARRALYDPSRPAPLPRLASPQPLASQLSPAPSSPGRQRDPNDAPRRRPESPSRPPRPIRKLFDPTVHNPHQFSRPPPASPVLNEGNLRGLKDAPTRSTDPGLPVRRSQLPRTAEEEADKERERRRRKEGSERGSGSSGRKKDEAGKSRASRSLGSRSSEGSESFKDRERGKGKGDTGVKAILKDIHDRIKAIEVDLTEMHRKMTADPEAGIAVLLEMTREYPRNLSAEEDLGLWLDLIGKHKQLADLHHDFLTRIFDPLVPPSLHQLTVRYNIPSRLWQNGFHLLLERLRLSWMTGNPSALDLLTDFVYDGYKFYTDLLEDIALVGFRTAWIEALGDLARYRMAIASRISATSAEKVKGKSREVAHGEDSEEEDDKRPLADGASIGAEVAERWDVEDTDTWRQTARDWYSMGITEKPGEGRLHHHLALLARDSLDGEGRALHHFTRSLMVTHEFPTARESILGLFDLASQRRQERNRSGKGEGVMDLFVRLHGMLFTRIELDKFDEVLEMFVRKIGEEVGQVEWMIMAAVNIAGIMQYGSSEGLIRKGLAQESAERRRAQAGSGEQEDGTIEGEEADGGEEVKAPRLSDGETNGVKGSDPDTWPLPLTCAFRLSFAVLEYTLRYPTISQGVHQIPNPCLTTFVTFLATLSRQPATAQIIIPWIPWTLLVSFLNSHCYGLKSETKLISGVPIPEDWLVRGSEWVGRRVYERGFWKIKSGSNRSSGGITAQPNQSGERWASETDVLMAHFEGGVDGSQGVVDAVEGEEVDGPVEVGKRRWKRLIWAGGVMLRYIEGLEARDGEVVIEGPLKSLVEDVERKKTTETKEVHSARKSMWDDLDDAEEEGWDGEEDEDLAVLRDRFKQLQSLIPGDKSRSTKTKSSRSSASRLNVVQGYTTLIFDTNVLLNSLSLFSQLVDSGRWTLVVPLPVLTELDGLAKEPPPLGIEAIKAISYLETNVRSKSMTLRIQTTKGSYLSDLRLRTETSTTTGIDGKEMDRKTMDERILDIAKWQLDNFVDRSLMLGGPGAGDMRASKAVLVTFDRNLRLRARGMGVEAVDEREMAGIFGK